MIGVPGKDRRHPVELFHQHGARHQMRPGRLAEGEQQIGFDAFLLRMPVRRAQHETRLAHAVIAPAPDNVRELFGGEVLALLVEQYRLVGGLRLGNAPAGLGQFGQLDRPAQPLFVTFDKLGLR